MNTRPYVRVYYEIVEDPRFERVYDNDRLLATWLRLLLVADAMYPSAAPVPQGCSPTAIKALVEAGLVNMVNGHRYHVHGLAAERGRRTEQARAAAAARYDDMRQHSGSTAGALRQHSGSTAGALLSTPRRDEPRRRGRPRDAPAQGAAPPAGPNGPTALRDLLPPPPGHPGRKAS